jgi:hypothetical protein
LAKHIDAKRIQAGAFFAVKGEDRAMISDLWHGRLPLAKTFWEFAVIYGVVLNILGTAGSVVSYSVQAPGWLTILLFALPILYYFFVAVAVWRSAAAYRGSQIWPELARGAVVILALSALVL